MLDNNVTKEEGKQNLEIVKFTAGKKQFGIDVNRVKEVLQPIPVTNIPEPHPYIEGMVCIRGELLPIISLFSVYGLENVELVDEKLMIAEWQHRSFVFRCGFVSQIYELGKEQLETPDSGNDHMDRYVLSTVEFGGDLVYLPDFEKIILDIESNYCSN